MHEIEIREGVDLEELRERLRQMTDKQLLRFGKTARSMCSTQGNMGQPPREVFVIQQCL
jgi:hypothetical protein